MIASLRGKLVYSDEGYIVVECAGVGYKCFVTKSTFNMLSKMGEEVFIHTYLSVREDAMDLYGFSSVEELKAFKLVISVNGVGAKIGIALLSEFTAEKLMHFIASNNAKALTAASGVGIKLAQRIVLELKDKASSGVSEGMATAGVLTAEAEVSALSEAVDALVALGYTKGEASLAVSRLDSSLSSSELIKEALKSLARRF